MATYKIDAMVSPIYEDIKSVSKTSPIKKDTRFDLGSLKLERQRLDTELKSKGYYNFNSEFLLFEADTNQIQKQKIRFILKIKSERTQKSNRSLSN